MTYPWEIPLRYNSDCDPSHLPQNQQPQQQPQDTEQRSQAEVDALIDRAGESDRASRTDSRPVGGSRDTTPMEYVRAGQRMDQEFGVPDHDEMDAPEAWLPPPKTSNAQKGPQNAPGAIGEQGRSNTGTDARNATTSPGEPLLGTPEGSGAEQVLLMAILPAKGGALVRVSFGESISDLTARDLDNLAQRFASWAKLARMVQFP